MRRLAGHSGWEEGIGSSMAKKRRGKTRDYVEVANRTLRENPATSLLGFEAVSVTYGRAVLKMEVQAKHRQLHGVVHGGILVALADTAAT